MTRRAILRARDSVFASYEFADRADQPLARLIPEGLKFTPGTADRQAVRHFLDHRFDLLGSGWVEVRHGRHCLGFQGVLHEPARDIDGDVNHPNTTASRATQAKISGRYRPIDWQLDFKSGHRWSQKTWYRKVRYGDQEGVDVKVPWELSRMQHLPELAIAYSHCPDERIAGEFRDQLLDWIATNPPRFGVNWASTMDAGIRVANWLIAFDLMRAAGARFDVEFTTVFTASVFDHAAHIVRNLEWSESHRANHYLGDIGGLLLAAAYLPADRQVDAWLLFAVQELLDETERQFMDDGGHFEASTSYHRLCAEIVAVAAAFVCALPASRIAQALRASHRDMRYGPTLRADTSARLQANATVTGSLLSVEFFERLTRAAEFTRSLTRSDGSVPLIGDDDSGRFLRLGGWRAEYSVGESRARYGNLQHFHELPNEAPYPMQSVASHQQWLAWASCLLGRTDLLEPSLLEDWSSSMVLAQGLLAATAVRVPAAAAGSNARSRLTPLARPMPTSLVTRSATHTCAGAYRPGGDDLFSNACFEQYPAFGLYIVRSERVHLAIRCGCAMNDHAGVHAHEDQLAFDLMVDGRCVAADPGTFAYTPAKRQRMAYRSAHAHHAPATEGPSAAEQHDSLRIFSAPKHVKGECLQFDAATFIGHATVEGGDVLRSICFHPDRIEVLDRYWLAPGWRPASGRVFQPARPVAFSPGYGWWLK